ncbi:protein FAM237A-like [Myxocyprinus asiaticus]|uniref:protein FAM237A-like n=1 Tax=Myxocyprinus asiaticus TaxID=70543 RepID=UPI002222AEFE|nr:protein FAM237A-like [Myxocyprinus asiaticus]
MGFLDGHWRRPLSLCLLMLAAASPSSLPNLEILNSEVVAGGRDPGSLGEINRECWDASSLAVIQARKLRVADTVGGLWDFMTYLRESHQPKHQGMFMQLAQVFWERYVDCVLSRAHGLGRRAPRQEFINMLTYQSKGVMI